MNTWGCPGHWTLRTGQLYTCFLFCTAENPLALVFWCINPTNSANCTCTCQWKSVSFQWHCAMCWLYTVGTGHLALNSYDFILFYLVISTNTSCALFTILPCAQPTCTCARITLQVHNTANWKIFALALISMCWLYMWGCTGHWTLGTGQLCNVFCFALRPGHLHLYWD